MPVTTVRSSALAFALLLASCAQPLVDPHPVPDPEPAASEGEDLHPGSGDEALAWLLAGNHRFWDGHPRHAHESHARAAMLAGGQHPFATVLGCSDSRVPPELIFDHGLGDLFVIRVAGNVLAVDESGSIEYAVEHLHTPLVVVLGHEGCGAVTAALGEHGGEPDELVMLLDRLRPALADVPADLPPAERVAAGVEANVRHTVTRLRALVQRLAGDGHEPPRVVGAIYQLGSGEVRVLEE